MAARKTPGPKAWPIFLPIYRKLDACGWVGRPGGFGASRARAPEASHAGRGEAPARCRPPIRNPPPSFRSAALELSASCVRAGFQHPGRRGRV